MSNFEEVVFSPLEMGAEAPSSPGGELKRDSETVPNLLGGKSTMFETSFNFVNSLLGAGVIGLPLAIQQCGMITGIVVFAIVAYFIYCSSTMMVACGIKAGVYNLEELCGHLLGPTGYYVSVISMFLFAYGGQTAYLVIIGDTIPRVAGYFSEGSVFTDRTFVIIFFSTVIILPLCLFRDLGHLAWSSFFALALELVLLFIIAFASFGRGGNGEVQVTPSDAAAVNLSLFAGIGTMSFALVCQHNSFLLFQSLAQPSLARWKRVAGASVGIGFIFSVALGLVGYLAFYPDVQGDIFNNFPIGSELVGAGRVVLAVTMLFTYPLELFVSRHALQSLLRHCTPKLQPRNSRSRRNRGSRSRVHFEEVQQSSDDVESVQSIPDRTSYILANAQQTVRQWIKWFTPARKARGSGSGGGTTTVVHYEVSQPRSLAMTISPLNHSNNDDDDDGMADIELTEVVFQPHSSSQTHTRTQNQGSVVNADYFSHNGQDASSSSSAAAGASSEMDLEYADDEYKNNNNSNNKSNDHNNRQRLNDYDDNDDMIEADADAEDKHAGDGPQSSLRVHLGTTVGIWVSTVCVALVAKELGVVSALTGTAAASTLGYTLPALLYLQSEGLLPQMLRQPSVWAGLCWVRSHWTLLWLPMTMLLFGVSTLFIGVTTVLVSVATGN